MITFLIERGHVRPRKYSNSPEVVEWRPVGAFQAKSTSGALERVKHFFPNRPDIHAQLRVNGIRLTVPNK